MTVVIVDTGCANLSSVVFAFDRLDIATQVSADADQIQSADRVLIPGVGAARYAMDSLRKAGLVVTLRGLTQPVMGICLGMQLLFETSDEGQTSTECLGYIPGDIKPMDTGDLPNPHMGWNSLSEVKRDPLLSNIQAGEYAYFVHSYAAPVSKHTIAASEYNLPFSAVVRNGNVWGCQFHPERSASLGTKILKNFSEITI